MTKMLRIQLFIDWEPIVVGMLPREWNLIRGDGSDFSRTGFEAVGSMLQFAIDHESSPNTDTFNNLYIVFSGIRLEATL